MVVVYPGLTTLELIGTVSLLDGLGISTGFRTATVEADTPTTLALESLYDETSQPFGLLVPGGLSEPAEWFIPVGRLSGLLVRGIAGVRLGRAR